ncbi:hypothetical protein ACFVWL_10390 [Microbacterium sp. NPDC058269]|uniref:hypothetical protein n=1 Tax=Microbacterium sp. NPDC058269 TaxID=3346414 RepID=UPI0036DD66B0
MSDVADVNRIHQQEQTGLQRRRELTAMTKPELIDYIVSIEDDLAALATRIDHAYGDEP